MKRLTVGRGTDCDIVVPDEKDNVSRHHMVLSFNIIGKMTVSDTSSNGTFINGTRMLKGASVPVTREDKIRLGDSWEFDWGLVPDPYRKIRRIAILISALLLFTAFGIVLYSLYDNDGKKQERIIIPTPAPDVTEDTWNADSTREVAPTEVSISTGKELKPEKRKAKRKNQEEKSISTKAEEKIDKKKDLSSEKEMPIVN